MRKKIPLIGGIINLIESLKGDIGIIENTDVATHSISAGSYVIWHNELYKASSAIAVDDALSASNLTAVSGGAANELNNKIKLFPDPTNILVDHHTSATSINYTATNDCFLVAWLINGVNTATKIKLNNVEIFTTAYATASSTVIQGGSISMFLKKGDTIQTVDSGMRYIIMGLR